MAVGELAHGIQVDYGGTQVNNLRGITPPGVTLDDIDVTTFAESVDLARKFKSGLEDHGELSFTVLYDAADYSALLGQRGTEQTWTVTFNDDAAASVGGGSTLSFTGYLRDIGDWDVADSTTSDVMEFSCTVKVSGKVTFTDNSA